MTTSPTTTATLPEFARDLAAALRRARDRGDLSEQEFDRFDDAYFGASEAWRSERRHNVYLPEELFALDWDTDEVKDTEVWTPAVVWFRSDGNRLEGMIRTSALKELRCFDPEEVVTVEIVHLDASGALTSTRVVGWAQSIERDRIGDAQNVLFRAASAKHGRFEGSFGKNVPDMRMPTSWMLEHADGYTASEAILAAVDAVSRRASGSCAR